MQRFKDKIKDILSIITEGIDFRLYSLDTLFFFGLSLIIFTLQFNHIKATRNTGIIIVLLSWIIQKVINKDWKIRTNPLLIPIAVFFAATLISMISCYNFSYTLSRIRGEILTFSLLFIAITDFCNTRNKTYIILYLFLISNLFTILLFFVVFCAYHFNIQDFMNSVCTKQLFFKGLPHTSTYFLFSTTFIYSALYYIKHIKGYFIFVPYFLLNLFFLFISNQRGALIGFFCVLFMHFLFFKQHRKRILQTILFIFIISVILIITTPFKTMLIHEDWSKIAELNFSTKNKEDSMQVRVHIQDYFFQYLKKHPFRGVGYGRKNLRKVEKALTIPKPKLTHAHNVFFNVALQTGLQGLLALLYLIFIQFKIIRHGFKESRYNLDRFLFLGTFLFMIGIWSRMQIDDVFRYGTALGYWVVMGMITSLWLNIKQEELEKAAL